MYVDLSKVVLVFSALVGQVFAAKLESGSREAWINLIRVKRGNPEPSLLDLHNEIRSMQSSSNMEYLIWNDGLADMASEYAGGCVFEHGQPMSPPYPFPIATISQNLYAANTGGASAAVEAWEAESAFYDYDTGSCSASQCGHYTQMVWAMTKYVGCASHFCVELRDSTGTLGNDFLYTICNYAPGGNIGSMMPFLLGDPCTECKDGSGWCCNGLCNSTCNSTDPSCECVLNCTNGGTLDPINCVCQCTDGYRGNQCEELCVDHSICSSHTSASCTSSSISEICPVLCGTCIYQQENEITTSTTQTSSDQTTTTTTTTSTTTTATSTATISTTIQSMGDSVQAWKYIVIGVIVAFVLVILIVIFAIRGCGPIRPRRHGEGWGRRFRRPRRRRRRGNAERWDY